MSRRAQRRRKARAAATTGTATTGTATTGAATTGATVDSPSTQASPQAADPSPAHALGADVFLVTRTPPGFKEPMLLSAPATVRYPKTCAGRSLRRNVEQWKRQTVVQRVLPWRESPAEEEPEPDSGRGRLPEIWTVDVVRFWLKEAMETLRASADHRPAQYWCGMPEVVREMVEACATDERPPRRPARPEEVTRLDLVLPWLFALADGEQRKAAVGVAMTLSLRTIGRRLGCSHERVRRLERLAVEWLVDQLNGGALRAA